jgi:hypothetical protein
MLKMFETMHLLLQENLFGMEWLLISMEGQ